MLYINFVGSARDEGFDLPAYVDLAWVGKQYRIPRDRVFRIHLPKFLVHKSRYYRFGKGE